MSLEFTDWINRMCRILFLLVTLGLATIDIPVIIDREFSRQFEADFLIDYDGERPPNNSVQVSVVLDVKYLKWRSDTVLLIAEVIQSWEDTRLLFPTPLSIFVPNEKKLWSPDSYFGNAIESSWENRNSRRLNRGFVYQKGRVKLVVPHDNDCSIPNSTECCQRVSVIFGSFDNAAVKYIKYNVTQVLFSCCTSPALFYCLQDQNIISPNGQKLNHLVIDIIRAGSNRSIAECKNCS